MGIIKNLIFRWDRVITPVIPTPVDNSIIFYSTSVANPLSAYVTGNTGAAIDWTVTGGLTIATVTGDFPNLDFSTNVGVGVVTVENITAVNFLAIQNCEITDIFIPDIIGVTTLTLSNNLLTNFSLNSHPSITHLVISNMPSLTSLDVSGNTLLTHLEAQNTGLSGVYSFTTNTNIDFINLGQNIGVTGIVTTGLTSLTRIRCFYSSINSLDISTNVNITALEIQGNSFSSTLTNQVLADLVANNKTNGDLHYRNNETGQGVTDRATLVSRGWTITNYGT